LKPTDIKNPDYFHKVVDCQWACPAHTPVPEYIRLIAHGRYSDAYMINWKSNVFPGILGRTCDRPCEPACRRSRVEDETLVKGKKEPVAICRLKRVAADYKDDDGIKAAMPKAPDKNGNPALTPLTRNPNNGMLAYWGGGYNAPGIVHDAMGNPMRLSPAASPEQFGGGTPIYGAYRVNISAVDTDGQPVSQAGEWEYYVTGYTMAQMMELVLQRAGNDLTRANLMKQAASMHDLVVPILLPGIKINTSPTDFYPIQSVQLARFDGETWQLFGEVLSSESS